ncbi:hypothetical protein [uncultured Tateyamaria sp.]|uniref:hypothetical protein n=1 Tax=uncultured Tateyamaria sp. TaxID=455651 RepID=UPI002629FC26|nr:hypothetical protein [uncultured Tateyamaria sp.]
MTTFISRCTVLLCFTLAACTVPETQSQSSPQPTGTSSIESARNVFAGNSFTFSLPEAPGAQMSLYFRADGQYQGFVVSGKDEVLLLGTWAPSKSALSQGNICIDQATYAMDISRTRVNKVGSNAACSWEPSVKEDGSVSVFNRTGNRAARRNWQYGKPTKGWPQNAKFSSIRRKFGV